MAARSKAWIFCVWEEQEEGAVEEKKETECSHKHEKKARDHLYSVLELIHKRNSVHSQLV